MLSRTIITAAVATLSSSAYAQNFAYDELPVPDGLSMTDIYIDDSGLIAGTGVTPTGDFRAVYWTEGQAVVVDPPAGDHSQFSDGDDAGLLIGTVSTQAGGTSRDAATFNPSTGQWTVVDALGGFAFGRGIASSGGMVGHSSSAYPGNPKRGWLGTGVEITELPPLPGHVSSWAHGVNAAGTSVGWSGPNDPDRVPVLWDAQGSVTALDVLGPTAGGLIHYAGTITESGLIVGRSEVSAGDSRAVVWDLSGAITELAGDAFAVGADITESGAVIGTQMVDGVIGPALWSTPQAQPTDLLPALPADQDVAGWIGGGMNASGTIVGMDLAGQRVYTLRPTCDDADLDGVCADLDNCPTVANPDQADLNGDGFGDACVSPEAQIDPSADVSDNAQIGAGAEIGPNASVGEGAVVGDNAQVGEGTEIYQGAVISDNAQVGMYSYVQEGAEVGAGASVGPSTYIRANAVIQAGASVGNNVEIGEDCVVSGTAQIESHVTLGSGCFVGDNTVLNEWVTTDSGASIGDGSTIGWATQLGSDATLDQDVEVRAWSVIGDRLSMGPNSTLGRGNSVGDDVTFEAGASSVDGDFMWVDDEIVPLGVSIPSGTTVPAGTVLAESP